MHEPSFFINYNWRGWTIKLLFCSHPSCTGVHRHSFMRQINWDKCVMCEFAMNEWPPDERSEPPLSLELTANWRRIIVYYSLSASARHESNVCSSNNINFNNAPLLPSRQQIESAEPKLCETATRLVNVKQQWPEFLSDSNQIDWLPFVEHNNYELYFWVAPTDQGHQRGSSELPSV